MELAARRRWGLELAEHRCRPGRHLDRSQLRVGLRPLPLALGRDMLCAAGPGGLSTLRLAWLRMQVHCPVFELTHL